MSQLMLTIIFKIFLEFELGTVNDNKVLDNSDKLNF